MNQSIFRNERATYVLIAGFIAFALSINLPWLIVPSSSASSAEIANTFVLHPASMVEIVTKFLLSLYFSGVLATYLLKPDWTPYSLQVSKLIVVIVLLFPFFTAIYSTQLAIDSRLIYKQVDQVVEDMEEEINTQPLDWDRQRTIHIQTAVISAMDTTVFDDVWGLQLIQPEHQTFFLQNFLGFSNETLNVTTKGWVFAVLVPVLLAMGLYLANDRYRSPDGLSRKFNLGLLLFFLALISPKLIGHYQLEQGKYQFALGKYNEAARNWESAGNWIGALDYSLPYHSKLGEMELRRGCTECKSVIFYQISQAINQKNSKQLEELLTQLSLRKTTVPGVSYWKGSLLIEQGINAFNSGQYGLAEEFWNKALVEIPISATAHYGLYLVNEKYGLYDRAAQRLAHIKRIQDFLSFKKMTISGQYYLMQSWDAISKGDVALAHYFYSLYLTPDNWDIQ